MPDRPTEGGHELTPRRPRGRVLLVDDEECIRFIAREILEAQGYQVAEAPDGEAGLATFLENIGHIDLVILDLVMPKMHGFQVMDAIRKVAPQVPILLSSGYSPEDRPEVLTPSPTLGFLAKPYRGKDLTAQVARLLG